MNSEGPTVSVVIPTRNCRPHLQRLLHSMDRQTFHDFEVIIVDNFSSDGTFELATSCSRAFQKGPERHIQRAFGASQARGTFLMFFDSDMELDPTLIQECVDLARTGFDAVIIPERGGGQGYWAACQKLEKECYWKDPWMEAANRFIRKEMYDLVGGYRTDLIAGEDFDLHDRLVALGARLGRTNAMVTHYEDARFWKVVWKKFYYAQHMPVVFQNAPKVNFKRFVLLKPAFLRNWRLLFANPLLTIGLILMKGTQFLGGCVGLLVGMIQKKIFQTH